MKIPTVIRWTHSFRDAIRYNFILTAKSSSDFSNRAWIYRDVNQHITHVLRARVKRTIIGHYSLLSSQANVNVPFQIKIKLKSRSIFKFRIRSRSTSRSRTSLGSKSIKILRSESRSGSRLDQDQC